MPTQDFKGTLNGNTPGNAGIIGIASALLDMNITTDQILTINYPPGYTKLLIQSIKAYNPSISLTTAVGGIYTAAAKGGVEVVAATQVYSALTTNAVETAGDQVNLAIVAPFAASYITRTVLYFSLTTAQGAAATMNIHIYAYALP